MWQAGYLGACTINGMRRYARIYRSFFTSALSRELEFRANFIAKVLQGLAWIVFFILILLVIFNNTTSIAGWSEGPMLTLAATCFLMNSLASGLFFSLMDIPTQVREGTLDFVVTKPVDSQFWVSVRKFNFDQIGSMAASLVGLFIGIRMSHLSPGPGDWLGFVILLVASTAIFYSLNLTLMTTAIWWVRVDNLWVFGDTIMQMCRFPVDIYGRQTQLTLTYILPLAFVATIPCRQLVQGLNWTNVGVGVAWALAALAGSRAFWRHAMRSYSSASS